MGRFKQILNSLRSHCQLLWILKILALWLFIVAIDQATKAWALRTLPEMNSTSFPYGGWDLGKIGKIQFALVVTYNTGAAWNFLEHSTQLLWAIRAALIAALGFYVLHRPKPIYGWPLAWMVGGALSNWIDQGWYGHVIDMLSVTLWGYMYPVFNVADSVICLSALGLVLGHKSKCSREN